MAASTPQAQRQIRRFDVFTEWNRLKAREKMSLPEDRARIYGLAVAKIVAGRGGGSFAGHSSHQVKEWKRRARQDDTQDDSGEAWWENFGSDAEFDDKIIHRMGEEFYRHVFQPAIRAAWDEGQSYEDIRDTLRESWNAHLAAKKKPRGSG